VDNARDLTHFSTRNMSEPARYGLIGSGRRAEDFARLALQVPERFTLAGVVTRSAERGQEVERNWRCPSFRTVQDLVSSESLEFAIVSVPWAVTPVVIKQLVELETPVLAETPPAPDLSGLTDLWQAVGSSGLVQVAEQYLLMPEYAAVLALLRSGALGEITYVSILSRGWYHSVSMLRHLLDVGHLTAVVNAASVTMPLADVDRRRRSGQLPAVTQAEHVTAILDFAVGRRGIYDFITDHWSNPLRPPRILARGSLGELAGRSVIRLSGSQVETAEVITEFVPGPSGTGTELHRIACDGETLYRNAYLGTGLGTEDLSVASLVDKMRDWCRREGPPPYPLAEASQDHLINLAIAEAASGGHPVETRTGPWSQ
jgi:predicted dehydrogenase